MVSVLLCELKTGGLRLWSEIQPNTKPIKVGKKYMAVCDDHPHQASGGSSTFFPSDYDISKLSKEGDAWGCPCQNAQPWKWA